jgi:CheY-like chemotaxis protein
MLFLYVEDDPTNRVVMEMLLNYELDDAQAMMMEDSTDFETRLATFTRRPDVFLLDIHVKPYNGFEMLKMIRRRPDYRHSKVVAVTASTIGEVMKDLMAAGFDGAITKPIRKENFADMIERIISGEQVWCVG